MSQHKIGGQQVHSNRNGYPSIVPKLAILRECSLSEQSDISNVQLIFTGFWPRIDRDGSDDCRI